MFCFLMSVTATGIPEVILNNTEVTVLNIIKNKIYVIRLYHKTSYQRAKDGSDILTQIPFQAHTQSSQSIHRPDP